jgi:hypothetical protein
MRSIDFSKPLFGNKHTSLQKLLAKANKTTERPTKFINKIKSRQLACANRAKSIPENATIRKEYIKCGKQMCELRHGPCFLVGFTNNMEKTKRIDDYYRTRTIGRRYLDLPSLL